MALALATTIGVHQPPFGRIDMSGLCHADGHGVREGQLASRPNRGVIW